MTADRVAWEDLLAIKWTFKSIPDYLGFRVWKPTKMDIYGSYLTQDGRKMLGLSFYLLPPNQMSATVFDNGEMLTPLSVLVFQFLKIYLKISVFQINSYI